MAIYHLHAQFIQRSQGHSVVAAAAYRRATKMFAELEQRHYDFSNKPDFVYGDISLPNDAPAWITELKHATLQLSKEKTFSNEDNGEGLHPMSEVLWNKIEAIEKRKDAQLAREIRFALPNELTLEQNIALAREFIEDQLCQRGMVVDWCFHNDDNNPHIHALITTRALTESGFGNKVRSWHHRDLLKTIRAQWAAYANYHLKLNQHDVTIDHRSYAEQGIELIPTMKEGKALQQMTARGIETERMVQAREIKQANLMLIAQNPTLLLDKIARTQPTFTQEDIKSEMNRYSTPDASHPLNLAALNALSLGTVPTDELTPDKSLTPLSGEMLDTLLEKIEQHDSVFSEKTLVRALNDFTDNAAMFAHALTQLKASPELIYLGAGDDGRNRYTTRRMFALENRLQTLADKWGQHTHRKLDTTTQRATLLEYESKTGKILTNEQQQAVKHILNNRGITCLVGRAGTGKSFSLGAARAVWEAQGMRVLGIALAGKAADSLALDAGIQARTIDSFRYALSQGQLHLQANDVIVMDEAGMTDSVSMEAIVQSVVQAGAKLVLVGDHAQLQPVGPGSSFRALIERLGYAEIQTIYRQKTAWQQKATACFAVGQIAQGLALYRRADKQAIQFEDTPQAAMQALVDAWDASVKLSARSLEQSMMMAYRNADVTELNNLARTKRIRAGDISEGYQMKTMRGDIKLSVGDRILLLKNHRALGLSNGRLATVSAIEVTEGGTVRTFTLLPDGANAPVTLNAQEYNDIAHGYAATVHKLQGATFDKSFAYVGGYGWDKHLTYVMMTRHRESVQLYADKATYADEVALTKALSQHGMKDSVMDFPLQFAARRGIDNFALLRLLPQKLATELATKLNNLRLRYRQWIHPHGFVHTAQKEADYLEKAHERQEQREDARLVAAYVDATRKIGQSWQHLQTTLQTLGLDRLSFDTETFSLIKNTASWQALEVAKAERNALSFQILQDMSRFELGLEANAVDKEKLAGFAEQHVDNQLIQRYLEEEKRGRVVHRDRIAAQIHGDMSRYYAFLKTHGIHLASLRVQAQAHKQRRLLITLNADEKAAFHLVANYHRLSKEAGQRFADYIKAKDDNPLFSHSKTQDNAMLALSYERDRLASLILQNRESAEKGLSFFEIGTTELSADSRFKTVAETLQASQTRWYRLQQSAARHDIRHRIAQYHQALFVGDMTQRRNIALDITHDVKSHHGAIIALHAGDKLAVAAFWQAIRRDAKQAHYLLHVSGLSNEEKAAYHLAARYMEAKQTRGQAWREILSEKTAQSLDNETIYQKLAPYTKSYTALRNALAAEILSESSPAAYLRHKPALAYFDIDIATLTKQASLHHRYETVQAYLAAYTTSSTSRLARGKLAYQIIDDPKAYHSDVIAAGLNWKAIYQDTTVFERHQAMQFLTPDEKKLFREMRRYRKLNQEIGKSYARLKGAPSHTSSGHKHKLAILFAKRDYRAANIVSLANIVNPKLPLSAFETNGRIKSEAVLAQAKHHQDKVIWLQSYQSAYVDVVNAVSVLSAALELPEGDAQHTALLAAFKPAQDALAYAETLKKINPHYQETALHYAALDTSLAFSASWKKQQQNLDNIKSILIKLSTRYHLNESTLRVALPDKALALIQAKHAASPTKQRIDVERLRELLNQQPEQVASAYLGEPDHRNAREWRYGSSGKLVVRLIGQQAGLWYNHKEGIGGDMLTLISHVNGITNIKSLAEAASQFLGGYVPQKMPVELSRKKAASTEDKVTPIRDAEMEKRLLAVHTIVKATVPIKGTLAEKYLHEHRGISQTLYSENLRYHPALKNWMTRTVHPALVTTARNDQDEIVGLQAIFLNPKTANKADLKQHTKLSRGITREGALIHSGKADGMMAYAEGLETALSVAEAHPDWNVHVTFGVSNFANMPLKSPADSIVLCAGNDGPDSGTAKIVNKAADKLAAHGKNVYVALPNKPDSLNKYDFNDALKQDGLAQVRHALDNRVLSRAALTAKFLKDALQDATNLKAPYKDLRSEKIEEILLRFIQLQKEQTRLTLVMNTTPLNDHSARTHAKEAALLHKKHIDAFVLEATNMPSIINFIQNVTNFDGGNIEKLGGISAIENRLLIKQYTKADLRAIVLMIHNASLTNRIIKEGQDRGRHGQSH